MFESIYVSRPSLPRSPQTAGPFPCLISLAGGSPCGLADAVI